MNKRLRAGKSSELIVAGELIRHGLDVYVPCVDDQAIDLVMRVEQPKGVQYYDVQIKSVKGHNLIIGVKAPKHRGSRFILIVHYRHDDKADEFFYLDRKQVERHHKKESEWKDLVLHKEDRERYAAQTLADLVRRVKESDLS